jgi:YggT family protein
MIFICIALTVYLVLLFASVILSWVAMARPLPYYGLGRKVVDAIFAVTNPVFRLVRGVVPPIRLGAAALDLSPVIVFIVVGILRTVICG